MSLELINEKLEKKRGKPSGYPEDMHYKVMEKADGTFELCVEDAKKSDDVWKKIDPWGFAIFDEIHDEIHKKLNEPLGLRFSMPTPSKENEPQYEALKRRLSYLAEMNKKICIVLSKGGKEDRLYTMPALDKRPPYEITRPDFAKRNDKDKSGRLEKDFQTFLFGKGLYDEKNSEKPRTNERLTIFGKDFIFNEKDKKKFCIEREWPTGVFRNKVSEEERILPTEYVDLVTINKRHEIAIIELKIDDTKLEVIAQLLNYALFFHSYKHRAEFTKQLEDRLLFKCDSTEYKTKSYLVSNVFHKRFYAVWPYYSRGSIAMQQIVMGYKKY